MTTIRNTVSDIREDLRRLHSAGTPHAPLRWKRCISLLLRPEVSALLIFRVSHYLYQGRKHRLADLFYKLNLLLTGADIHPSSKIGPGCLIVHTVGTIIFGTIGKHATLYAHVFVGPTDGNICKSSSPRIGDNVIIGSQSTVIGSISVADDVTIAPCSLVDTSISDEGCLVARLPGETKRKIKRLNAQVRRANT